MPLLLVEKSFFSHVKLLVVVHSTIEQKYPLDIKSINLTSNPITPSNHIIIVIKTSLKSEIELVESCRNPGSMTIKIAVS